MIDYGIPPEPDEIEVTIFGPGYGEAIAIHLEDDSWVLIDSCIDPNTGRPAQFSYLNFLGITTSKIRTIVASHWHDDHVRGIAALATVYSSAEFVVSSVFDKREARAFLAAYSGRSASELTKGTRELYDVIKNRKVFFVNNRSIVFEYDVPDRHVIATALSPVQQAMAQSIANFAKYIPSDDKPINNAPELTPNFESVAIHIDFGSEAILFGSDLEEDMNLGWSAILSDKWSSNRRTSNVYKVAHHGSDTGDTPGIWTNLLSQNPIALMTPFVKGRNRLPKPSDTSRILAYTPNAFISSSSTKKPKLPSAQLKRLNDICIGLGAKHPKFGAVRIRKKITEPNWRIEQFGAATKL